MHTERHTDRELWKETAGLVCVSLSTVKIRLIAGLRGHGGAKHEDGGRLCVT